MRTLPALSTIYLRAKVTAVDEAGSNISIANDAVDFAFMLDGKTPAVGDWKTGSWGAPNVARILIGPGAGAATALTAGNQYQVWVRVTDNPEVPVLQVDTLNVV